MNIPGDYSLIQVHPTQAPETPLVSVCVQTYQHANYIKECLDSILIQKTDFEFEILLGEDESTDGTREICLEYAEKYPDKIRLFLHSRKNVISIDGNQTGRFNLLYNLNAAKGKYIALCEGDDYWTDPLKLQKQVDFFKREPGYALCFHPVRVRVGEEVKDDFITKDVQGTTTIYELAKGNFIHTPSVMMRRNSKVINTLGELCPPLGDYVLHILNAQYGKIKKLPDCMANYRVHEGGIWSSRNTVFKLEKTVEAIEILERAVEKEFSSVFSSQKEQLLLSLLELSENDLEKLKSYSVKLIENNPAILLNQQMRLKKQTVSQNPSFIQKIKQCLKYQS